MEEPVQEPRSFQQLEQRGLELLAAFRGLPVSALAQSPKPQTPPPTEIGPSYLDQYLTSHRHEDSFQTSNQKDLVFTKRPWTQVNPVLVSRHFLPQVSSLTPNPLEKPFGQVIKTLNHQHSRPGSYSPLEELANIVKRSQMIDDGALSLWDLLRSITKRTERITDPLKGGQKCFENRFKFHIRLAAQKQGVRSGDFREELKQYLKDQQMDSKEPVWMSIYYSMRAGECTTAAVFAKKAHFPDGFGLDLPEYYFSTWAQRPSHSPWIRFPELFPACLEFVRRGARKKLDSEYRYMVMSASFLCGQIHAVDRLISETPHCWDSLDEYLWYSIGCVRMTAENSSSYSAFDLDRLQTRLTASEESYYTSNGEDPLRYALVLFSVLELRKGLRFLLTNMNCSPYVIHTVHMVIALQWQGLLMKIEGTDQDQLKEEDIVDLTLHYARAVADHDPGLAWEYYYLSQELYTSSIEARPLRLARCLVDLLDRPHAVHLLQGEAVLVGMEHEGQKKIIMEEAAKQCKEQGKLDIALALFLRINSMTEVVRTMNGRIAKFILQLWTYFDHRRSFIDLEKWKIRLSEIQELFYQCKEFHDVIPFTYEEREVLIKETRALEKVFGIVQDSFSNNHDSVIREFEALEFFEDDRSKFMMEEYPSMVDLISEVVSIFCESLLTMRAAVLDGNGVLLIISQLKQYSNFIDGIPPPFMQKWSVMKKLEVTEQKLLESNQPA